MEAMHRAKREIYEQRHSQDKVDPERRELLTRMRKLAMARIEREAKEREELENQRANVGHQQQEQQQQQEEEEEEQQQRHQEQKQGASAAPRCNDGSSSPSSGAAVPTQLTFRPAPRVSGRSNSDAAGGAPDASNFIVRWSNSGSDLADRQFSVLADEDYNSNIS